MRIINGPTAKAARTVGAVIAGACKAGEWPARARSPADPLPARQRADAPSSTTRRPRASGRKQSAQTSAGDETAKECARIDDHRASIIVEKDERAETGSGIRDAKLLLSIPAPRPLS